MAYKIGTGIQLKDAVKTSLWVYEPAVLYWAAVQQFKTKQSKKRCIAIYDTFISSDGPWRGAIAESSDSEEHAAQRRQMGSLIDEMRELRQKASAMGFLERFSSSSTRRVHADFFDSYNNSIRLEEANGVLTNFLQSPQERRPVSGWKINAEKAKLALDNAGFDIKALGLQEI